MTVEELIRELEKLEPTSLVVVLCSGEGGYDSVNEVSTIRLNLNANTDVYYGAHERSDDDGATPAYCIS